MSPSVSVSPSPSPEFAGNTPIYLKYDPQLSMRLRLSRISTWNTLGRPTGSKGAVGFNTDLDQIEVYDGSAWYKITLTAV